MVAYCWGGVGLALFVSPTCTGPSRRRSSGTTGYRPRRPQQQQPITTTTTTTTTTEQPIFKTTLKNLYDDWRSDAVVVDTMHLEEENVLSCLEEFINSEYGKQMFGCHDRPASVGVTGQLEFVDLCGPEVTLQLSGQFWHRRSTVLGRAAMWLNARMPEITEVTVSDLEELQDTKDILDEFGELLFQEDKRSPDFNGDRATMEYQGMDPDMRGPFPQSGRIEFN